MAVTAAAWSCYFLRSQQWLPSPRLCFPLPLPPRRFQVSPVHCCSASPSSSPIPTTAPTSTSTTGINVASSSYFPKRGQTVELVCESLAFGGKGVCKVADTGFAVMCDRALPGERFIGRVVRKKGNYAEVKKLTTISPHLDFVNPPCDHAFVCGGCKAQSLLYETQVRAKEEQVHELITRVGRFPLRSPDLSSVLQPIVPCSIQYHYRNKMEFSFGTKEWWPEDGSFQDNGGALGLHAPGLFDKILNVRKCFLQSDSANKVSIVNNVNSSVGNTAIGEAEHILYGKPTISEILRGLTFQISANSFFQTNSHQAEVLYKLIEEFADLRGDRSEIVLDLFCGTATIGLTLAKKAKHVYGYEVVTQAVMDACENAKMNDIHNATFIQGDLNKIDDKFGKELPHPDIVIVADPNRPGMHFKLIKYLLNLRVSRIILCFMQSCYMCS